MTNKTIGTHSGTFHADESLACYMLRWTREFKDAVVVRSRDPEILKTLDILVDVGAEYDPSRHRYDHHQRGFTETMEIDGHRFETKLSSAGLIYRHFGMEVLANICEWDSEAKKEELAILYRKIYECFVEGFDGNDNGIARYPPELKPKYQDSTHIAARISRLSPWWNEPPKDDMDERFAKAVEIVGSEFLERVRYTALSWLPARSIVAQALANRFTVHPSGKIIVFEEFCPWKEHLHVLEEEQNLTEKDHVLYALYSDYGKDWRVQAVPKEQGSFESRKALPEPWRGLRDQDLSEKIGIADCVFVHQAGFIGGNKSKEGALKMAIQAIEHQTD